MKAQLVQDQLFITPPLGHSLKRATRFWARPWYQLRRELGLPSTAELNPLVDGLSPLLHLALFSRWLADKQPDWPAQTAITSFPFHDRDGAGGLPPALARFLNEGPPPGLHPRIVGSLDRRIVL